MEPEELECDNCGWQGDSTMLADAPDDPDNFAYCPDCGSDEIVDYVNDDEEE